MQLLGNGQHNIISFVVHAQPTKALCDEVELIDIRVSGEERLPRQHLREQAAYGPDINGFAIADVPH